MLVVPVGKIRKKLMTTTEENPPRHPLKIDQMFFTSILIMCNLVSPDHELSRANIALFLLVIYGTIQMKFLKG